MFDANARYIPVGKKFFAEVHCVDSEMCRIGVITGDIILCEHIFKGEDEDEVLETAIWTKQDKDKGHYNYLHQSSGYGLLVYSGRPDGTGFINNEWKQKALDFLGGKWNE